MNSQPLPTRDGGVTGDSRTRRRALAVASFTLVVLRLARAGRRIEVTVQPQRGPAAADTMRHGFPSGLKTFGALLAAAFTVIGIVGGLWFNAAATQQAATTQAAERFTKNVEQLGSANRSVRIGAVYGFSRLISDDPERPTSDITKILSSFLRIQTTAPDWLPKPTSSTARRQLTPDMLAALDVLKTTSDAADLSGLQWPQIETSDLTLPRAKLTGANLSGAKLTGANLRNADLSNADLRNANLSGAKLE